MDPYDEQYVVREQLKLRRDTEMHAIGTPFLWPRIDVYAIVEEILPSHSTAGDDSGSVDESSASTTSSVVTFPSQKIPTRLVEAMRGALQLQRFVQHLRLRQCKQRSQELLLVLHSVGKILSLLPVLCPWPSHHISGLHKNNGSDDWLRNGTSG